MCLDRVKIKMRKCVGDSGMKRGGGGRGRNQRELKKQNEVVHYRLWSPPLPLAAHYFRSYLRRKDISLFLGGGVCECVCAQRGDWGLVYYNY